MRTRISLCSVTSILTQRRLFILWTSVTIHFGAIGIAKNANKDPNIIIDAREEWAIEEAKRAALTSGVYDVLLVYGRAHDFESRIRKMNLSDVVFDKAINTIKEFTIKFHYENETPEVKEEKSVEHTNIEQPVTSNLSPEGSKWCCLYASSCCRKKQEIPAATEVRPLTQIMR